MLLFGIKNCDSVRKAVKFCKTHDIEYTLIDFRESPVDERVIKEWLATGVTIKALFNSRSTTYRTLKLKDKNLNDQEKIEWLAKENLLIKRPILSLDDGRVVVGFDEAIYKELLTN